MALRLFWDWMDRLTGASRRTGESRLQRLSQVRKRVRPYRCAWGVEELDQRIVPAQLINFPDHHDMVYNAADQILYVTGAAGTVQRYDTVTETVLTPWTIGGNLYGAAITDDGQWMYVGDKAYANGQAAVHKINLATGAVTNLTYAINPGEGGSYDVAIMPNGIALFSGVTDGPSGYVPIRQIDLTTDTITLRSDFGLTTEYTFFDQSPDRSIAYVKSAGPYGGFMQVYSAVTNSVVNEFNVGMNPQYSMGSFSRDGSQYVTEFGEYPAVMDNTGHTSHLFPNLTAGVAFDPNQDILYIGDDFGDELRAYDTKTWDLLYTMSAGENIINSVPLAEGEFEFGNGKIFMETPQGIRVFTPPAPTVDGTYLKIDGFVSRTAYGFNTPITVSARDADGNILTGYTGTVHFTSDDPLAILPADYTFTAADAGVHTFPITYHTPGFHELTVSDTVTPNLSTRLGGTDAQNVPVEPGVLSIYGTTDLVYDAGRQILYMPTIFGQIERYDVANETMLPAWSVGGRLNGADLSLDGRYLYVADQTRTAYEGFIYKIDLDTGEYVDLPFGITSMEGGAFDIAVAANGRVLISASFLGSGSVYLRELDTATDTIKAVKDSNGTTVEIPQSMGITPGPDHRVLVFTANFGTGFSLYYSDTDTFGPGVGFPRFWDGSPVAVNRDSTQVAISHQSPLNIYNAYDLEDVFTLSGTTNGAVAFDPLRDIMYVVDSDRDLLVALDTNTWAELYTQPIGENLNPYGMLTVSADGLHAFFTRSGLVRVYDLQGSAALQIANASIVEGDAGQSTVTVTVNLSGPATQTVTVNYATSDGTAVAGSDYTSVSGTLTFLPGEKTKTISIPFSGDPDFELNETFKVTLTNSVNAAVARAVATVVIQNDDTTAPVFSGLESSVTFLENDANAAALLIDGDVTFTDADTVNFKDGNLVVAISAGGGAEDQLGIRKQGASPGQITVSGTTVLFGGIPFATIVQNGSNGGTLEIVFTTSVATPQVVATLLENLTYRNTSETPASNRDITITVTDADGLSSNPATIAVTITPQGEPPTISTIGNQSIAEDTSLTNLAFAIDDIDSLVSSLIVSATSSNQTLLPNANISLGGSGANRTLGLTPAADQSGTTTITVTVSDGTLSTLKTFVLTVTPVNDGPVISDIANESMSEDALPLNRSFTVIDSDTPRQDLVFTATSSNTTLVPVSNITVTPGAGSNYTVRVTLAPNQSGSTTITLTVSDGQASSSDSFDLTVTPVNDPPTISHVANLSTDEDTATAPLSFTIGDVDTPLNGLIITSVSSDQSIVPSANLVLGGSGTNRTLTVTPASNQSGPVTITLTVSDGTLTAQDSFTLTVLQVADAPTITSVNDQTIAEDSGTNVLGFTIDDIDTAIGDLTVTATSTDTTLVPLSNIVIGGTGASRTVQVTPAANQSGTVTITLNVFDGVASSSETFDLTVTPLNDGPTISNIADRGTLEDVATPAISFTVSDVDTLVGTLVVTAVSSDLTIVPNANIVLGGVGGSRTIIVTPASNQSGVVTITVSVSDGSLIAQDSFVLTVTPVDDAPTLSALSVRTIDEDQSTSQTFTIDDLDTPVANLVVTASSSNGALIPNANVGLSGTGTTRTVTVAPLANASGTSTITISIFDGSTTTSGTFVVTVNPVNDGPTISAIANQSINEDQSTGLIDFTIGDLETLPANLTVTATSSNSSLVPDGNLMLSGSGANRALTATPLPNQSGSAIITVSVSDGAITTQSTFTLTVTPVNDAPTITSPPSPTIAEDTSTLALSFTVGDLESTSSSLVVTATSLNQLLIPDGNLVLGGSGTNRTLTATPAANQSGTATITLTVSDGTATTSTTFVVNVTPANDSPSLVQIADQATDEDTSLSAIPVTLTDVDTPAGNLTLTATSSNPGLIPNSNIVLTGNGANRTMRLTPAFNQSGTATITLSVTDGFASSSHTFQVTVDAVNDAPTIVTLNDVTIPEDTIAAPVFVTVGDIDSPVDGLTVTATSSNPSLVPDSQLVVSGTGAERSVTITPLADQFGTTTITISVTEGDQTTSTTFLLTVTNVNDAPTISAIGLQSINEDHPTSGLPFTIGDLESLAGDLTLSASSSVPSLISAANVTFGGSAANRTIIVTPQSDQVGLAVITITVSDGARTAATSFAVIVNAVNDVPSFTIGADQVVQEDAAPVVVANWATNVNAGPADESAQTITFAVSTDHPELFSAGPTISSTGELTYTVAPDANGVATVTVTLQDDGGTANGGQDTSVSQSFTISITPVDDSVEFPPQNQEQNYSVGGAAVSIDPNLSVADPDNPNVDFADTQITVSGGGKKDLLSLPVGKAPKAASNVIRAGSKVFYLGQQVATITGGKKGIPLKVTFGPSASEAAVNAVLKVLNFKTKGKQTGNPTRTLHIAVQNATNTIHAETTRTIRVHP